MADVLSWSAQNETLALAGPLDRETLLPLWQQRDLLLAGTHTLDVSALERVDSAGLALLLHLYQQQVGAAGDFTITGASDRLKTLITVYNLNDLIPVA